MKRLTTVYFVLLVLTLASAFLAETRLVHAWIPVVIIMVLVCIKFGLVVLEYMEMRKSNSAWKFGVLFPAVITALIIGIFAIV